MLAALAVVGLGGCGGSAVRPNAACGAQTWIATWSADPSDALGRGLVGQTVRTILTTHLAGDTLRVHLSNRLGSAPVSFQAASLGIRTGTGAGLAAGSRRPVTFAGAGTVTVLAGAEAVSDPVSLRLTPTADLAVSLYVAGASGPASEHAVGQQTSYLTQPGSGDHTGDEAGGAFTVPTMVRYFVSGIDVRAPASVGDVVALGDSITDGFGGPSDKDDRYPDFLARRLAAPSPARSLSVVNAGISGNRVLSDGQVHRSGPSGLDRLGSDVIGQPGVRDVIVLEGINDIAGQAPADRVIAGLQRIVAQLQAAGLGVQLGTLTPFGGSSAGNQPASPAEAARLQVNRWIRGGGDRANGIVDFDAAVRDPAVPARLNPAYDSGDHLHPNAEGRRAMAGVVNLAGLRRASC